MGVYLENIGAGENDGGGLLDSTGHEEAGGYRGAHRASASRVAITGDAILKSATEAIAREISSVATVLAEQLDAADTDLRAKRFAVDTLDLKFGVKAAVGAGKAVEAFLAASGEGTVEVTLSLRHNSVD